MKIDDIPGVTIQSTQGPIVVVAYSDLCRLLGRAAEEGTKAGEKQGYKAGLADAQRVHAGAARG